LKLLVLSPVFPDAPSDGDRLRLYHWIAELGRRHEIHLACFVDPSRAADRGPSGLGKLLRSIHTVAWPRRRRLLAAGARLLGAAPSGVAALASREMRDLVDSVAGPSAKADGGAPFDAVLAYRLKMAPYALRFRGPRFLDYTDSMTRYAERRAADLALRGAPLRAAFARVQAGRMAAYEAWCAGQFDAGFFNSRQDCEAVQAMHPAAAASLRVAANGVDADAYRAPTGRSKAEAKDPFELLFVGHLAYPPNADAVAWFATEVLPLVRARVPKAFFTVVGGDASPGLRALGGLPGVRFAGFARDTRPYLYRAAVSVCPVRTGAGRQNKLLEAFAAGIPAVATSLAAQGAEARDREHLLVADDAPVFADAVIRLLERPVLGRRLALNARALVRRSYVWPENAAVLEGAMLGATRRPLW
jgi:glycosyltransferase involved in cell wall biosynthesis